jgi:hypothetical protein
LGIVVGDDGGFEGFEIFGVLQRADDRFGGGSVADGVAARALLAFFCYGTGISRLIVGSMPALPHHAAFIAAAMDLAMVFSK